MREQRTDGSWVPLWFGNQHEANQENPTYGTGKVLLAAESLPEDTPSGESIRQALGKGARWLLDNQSPDGGWGAGPGTPSTIEETGFALEGLAAWKPTCGTPPSDLETSLTRGIDWLVQKTHLGTEFPESPIGLYFARLWYSERLYPRIATAAALNRIQLAQDRGR